MADGRHAGHALALADLRRQVARLDHGPRRTRPSIAFGIDAIDRHLPWGGLPCGALHECQEHGLASEHAAAATLFVAGILARTRGPILWCLRGRDLFAPALASVGLEPDRVVYAETCRDADVLPAMEEGLRHGGLAGVVGEVARLSLVASRRLQLAAERTGVPAFILRRWRSEAERNSAADPSAVSTRWRVGAAPSWPLAVPGLGRAAWRLELLRCRGAEPTTWIVEACDAEGRLALLPLSPDRASPQNLGEGRGHADVSPPERRVARAGGRA